MDANPNASKPEMESSQPMRGSFTCSFTTRACSHAPIFATQYKRTNRTKGLKIMRCFPHCCPRHMSRSYCGAPVYLQVDWEGAADDLDGSKGISPEDEQRLKVVARFRTRERGGLSVGQNVPRSVIVTQQEVIDPEVEWVSASLIASANRNSWLFEINKLARWFYRWEVGPTRERRFKPHVFEAYLFYDTDLQSQALKTSKPDEPDAVLKQYCHVLAVACSPHFTLISSRRARDGGASNNDDDEEQDETLEDKTLHDDDKFRESIDGSLSTSDTEEMQQDSSLHPELPPDRISTEDVLPRTISQQLAVLSWFLDQLPLTGLLQHVSTMDSYFTASLLDELQDSAMEEIIHQKRRRSSSSAMVLSRLLVNAASSAKSLPTAAPAPNHALPSKSIQQILELAMWVFFDKVLGKQMNRFLQRSSRGILEKAELNESYLSWLQWLKAQMDGMLAGQASSTEQLINGLCTHYSANPRTATKIRWLCAPSSHEQVDRAAWQVFIAHVREVYLSTAPLSMNAQLAKHRLQPLPLASSSSSVWSGFTGTWLCMLEDVKFESSSRRTNLRNSVPSASVLLWFWRQLSCISLTTTNEVDTPALLLSSVFNRSLSDNQLSRLVLDNQPRWFRCLPSGESTIGVSMDGQLFGDYIAWLSTDDSINVQTYSWPSKSVVSSSLYAYCWQWQIAQSDTNCLCVSVKVERGRYRGAQSASVEEEELGTKLEQVDVWELTYELQLAYTRLY